MIDIVIVNWRTPWDLERALRTLRQNPPSTQFNLTVVNVEPEEADTYAAHENLGWVDPSDGVAMLIPTQDNIGYAQACNLGAEYGDSTRDPGQVIGLFNADVEFTPGVIDECVDALLANDRWAVVGPRQVNRDGRFTAAGIVGTRERPRHRGWMKKDTGQFSDVVSCPTVAGSAYFIKRHVWDELTFSDRYRDAVANAGLPFPRGAFLPTEHFYEETFCSYHAIERGYECVYFGPARMIHNHQGTGAPPSGAVTRSRQAFRQVCDEMGIPHD